MVFCDGVFYVFLGERELWVVDDDFAFFRVVKVSKGEDEKAKAKL